MGPDCEARGVSCDVAVSALQARDSNRISELPLIPELKRTQLVEALCFGPYVYLS